MKQPQQEANKFDERTTNEASSIASELHRLVNL